MVREPEAPRSCHESAIKTVPAGDKLTVKGGERTPLIPLAGTRSKLSQYHRFASAGDKSYPLPLNPPSVSFQQLVTISLGTWLLRKSIATRAPKSRETRAGDKLAA
mmetsp:Transcript_10038/g.42239  ORF Transcript_10038/g.42239 Transcript_10038/m.42239 type:complete len:106 (+) Transcript_10038:2627-2944(+)